MMAWKLLWRSWRGGQLALIFWSLVMAVVVVTAVALLADRVEKALVKESSHLLAVPYRTTGWDARMMRAWKPCRWHCLLPWSTAGKTTIWPQ